MADEERLERLRALKERISREKDVLAEPRSDPRPRSAATEEVELPYEKGEYEIIPISPLRRLEKRMEQIESTRTMTNLERFVDKVIDMVGLNQKIVEEMVKANQGLREDVAVLIGKLDELYTRLGDFIDIIKSAGAEEGAEAVSKQIVEASVVPVVSKIEEMTRKSAESSAAVVEALGAIDKRLRAIQLGGARPLMRRPPPAASPYTEGAGGP